MALQPQPPQGVLHHVADNPVGRKKLGGGGDIAGGDFAFGPDHLILALRDVELVQPADNLHTVFAIGTVAPVGFRDVVDQSADDGVLVEQAPRHKQRQVVLLRVEQERQALREGLTLHPQQPPIEGFIRVRGAAGLVAPGGEGIEGEPRQAFKFCNRPSIPQQVRID